MGQNAGVGADCEFVEVSPMSDPTRKEIVAQLRGAVGTALWIGMTPYEIKAIVTTLLIEREG